MNSVFTPDQIAKLVGFSLEVVSRWIDARKLLCYQIPGTQERLIHKTILIQFLRDNGYVQALEKLGVTDETSKG